MTNRRDFLKINLGAASVAVFAPGAVFASSKQGIEPQPLYAFLFDVRISEATSLANTIAGRARKSFSADGDLAELWMQVLRPKLQKSKIYVAGITSGYHAFSLKEVASDFGHAILHSESFNAEHTLPDARGVFTCGSRLNCMDSLSLNTPGPTFWLLGPSGINFHS